MHDDGTYQWNDTEQSTFAFQPDSGLLRFQGPLSDVLQADYTASNDHPRIVLQSADISAG